ncbi:haloacid dehalogenase type II [Pseudoroseomonas cervicalis]|uniref:Haloacid dehalogenase, type II n=1 Tax=Pseudoroseomonas cervicalis ATCC 49957 TaxID=525371 RepID=D5RH34_9PROT|nr:haloacid dehalogenase type II [Pseudoroseomonas cervicalis]EFH13386.1 haloacid dehalogenase, type II [Pseudoroseomonas cervicalis ATCC 49957]
MTTLRPKYITFDCYGTLTNFQMGPLARQVFADRVPAERMDGFVQDFAAYRLDEILGDWKPYAEVLRRAVERSCKRHGIAFREADGRVFYEAVPGWGPHPDVPEPLARVAREFPLVILSNAANEQIHHNVALLRAPFHAVYTAEMAGAYKPRFRAFEYMFDQLGCDPKDILHVSSSYRYDLMSAHDLRIGHRAHVARGHEPVAPHYGAHEIADIGGLPGLLGL